VYNTTLSFERIPLGSWNWGKHFAVWRLANSLNVQHSATSNWVYAPAWKIQTLFILIDIQEKSIFCFVIGLQNLKNHRAEWRVYLSLISWDEKTLHTQILKKDYVYCVVCRANIKLSPWKTGKSMVQSGYRLMKWNRDSGCQRANKVKVWTREWMRLMDWGLNRGGQKFWVLPSIVQGRKVLYLLNTGRHSCVTLSVTVEMRQSSVMWHCQCLYQRGSVLLCDTASACTNMAEFCCVILWVPLPTWQCSVVWYCQCLHQHGRALLCYTVNACSNVAVLCCLIL
jgi:hypothetical protein